MMITVCTSPEHDGHPVTHAGDVCPICAQIVDLNAARARALSLMDQLLPHISAMSALLDRAPDPYHEYIPPDPGAEPEPTPSPNKGAIKATITTDPEPEPVDAVCAKVVDKVNGAEGYHECRLRVHDYVQLHGIRTVKNAYRASFGEPAARAWDAAELAREWASRVHGGPDATETGADAPPVVAEPDAPSQSVSEPADTMAAGDAEEPDPDERDVLIRDRLAELRRDFTTRPTLAKVYHDVLGAYPPGEMEPVEMRLLIAEAEIPDTSDAPF